MKKRAKFATGGQAGFDWSGLTGAASGVADGIMSLLGTKPSDYSNQPIMNTSTIKGMTNPYSQFAFGGDATDGMDEDQMQELQQKADELGLTLEEYIEQLNNGGGDGSDTTDETQPDETPEIPQDDTTDDVPADEPNSSAFGFSDQEFATGGVAGKVPINVEDKEVIETPDGQVGQVDGKTHEQGGENLSVPHGTKIFSDRLTVEGQTMQERKLKRETKEAKLQKLLKANPLNKLLKNTVDRTQETLNSEDAQDMMLQKAARHIYSNPQEAPSASEGNDSGFAWGGIASFDTGGEAGDEDYPWLYTGQPQHPQVPYRSGYGETPNTVNTNPINTNYSPLNVNAPVVPSTSMTIPTETSNPTLSKFGTIAKQLGVNLKRNAGDYVGIAGNAFNALAPIINTRNMAKNTKPNVNRYLGFGKNALDSNQAAINLAGTQQADDLTDIDTSANSSYARNNNSASDVSTSRALNIATDIAKNKARTAARSKFSNSLITLLGQRGQLQNQKDNAEMRGQTMADTETKADSDNFYSNMAQNLVNFGTNVQGVGKSLNVSKSNRVNAAMISQLSKYGLDIDEDGNLKNKGE